jgi:hypothetical protein
VKTKKPGPARREVCQRGHRMTDDNVWPSATGGRNCLACRRMRCRAAMKRYRAAQIREPLYDNDFYERWEKRQRERWAIESLAFAQERTRRRRGKRDFLGVVSLLLAVIVTCITIYVRSHL